MKRHALFSALNETTHALKFSESAAKRFTGDAEELEATSKTATSVAVISNRLADAQHALVQVELEIRRLIQEIGADDLAENGSTL